MSEHLAPSLAKGIRSFIAVPIPPEAAAGLRVAHDSLRRADTSVKWVDPEGFHITLKFLGSVDPGRLQETWTSVVQALHGTTSFTMRFVGVGAFPSVSQARVIWAGTAEGATELAELAQRVESACEQHGFAREERPFRAHLTLGRAREPRSSPGLASAMGALEEEPLGEMRADRVVLMRSELTPRGAIYQALQEHMLS